MNSRQKTIWTEKDICFLCEQWGILSVNSIAKHLGRTVTGVSLKAKECGLGCQRENSDMILAYSLFKELGITNGWQSDRILRAGLRYRVKKYRNRPFRMIHIEDFWEFAEKNPKWFDFSKLEENALGAEPEWVKVKRKEDFAHSLTALKNKTLWSKSEEQLLKDLVNMHYTLEEIANRLRRSVPAIRSRMFTLGLKIKPADKINKKAWNETKIEIMQQMIEDGKSYREIANAIGKTEDAIRSKARRLYSTENPEKIRERLCSKQVADAKNLVSQSPE